MNEHARIWRFRIDGARRKEFEQAYSSEGAWAQLFRRETGYLGTTLWQDAADNDVYYTQDTWRSEADFETFKERYGSVYEQMDKQFEGLTKEETFVAALNRRH